MYDYIKGILVSKNFPYCTIECSNIGYLFLINSRTLKELPELNEPATIYTKLIHKEDSMTLCGFKNKQDRVVFDILTSVSGIGVKVAFALLDEFETSELINYVIDENYKAISKTKGVGAKMAQKIVIEIKDKLIKMDFSTNTNHSKIKDSKTSDETIAQTITILKSLGYSENEYNNPLKTALSKLEQDDPQELIKQTLQILSAF